MKRIITGIVAVGLVVPAVAVASRVASDSTRTAIVPDANQTSRAGPYIYWTNAVGDVSQIGRATLNGTGVDRHFIALPKVILPWGVAVGGGHIYWTAVGTGRANVNGTGVNERFMPPFTLGGPLAAGSGLALAGGYIYWINYGSIGRAKVDGSDVTPMFITGAPGSVPVAVTVAGGYIYWANEGSTSGEGRVASSIGRARIDGTGVNEQFIVGTHAADAVTVAGGYIYWANIPASARNTTIGRAKLNGTAVNQRFLPNTIGLALASSGPYIYGSDFHDIWRARLNGTGLSRHFIALTGDTEGLAIH